jgi:hypothetical protein
MSKATAGYSYQVRHYIQDDKTLIIIEDENNDRKSVTNDIENVVADIIEENHLSKLQCLVIYRDSAGTWDGWDLETERFISLNHRDMEPAITKLFKLKT